MMHHWFRLLPVVFLMWLTVACRQTETNHYEVFSQPDLQAGDVIPAPAGEIILTMTGKITAANVGDSLAFDMVTLEKLGLVQYTVYDPWANAEATYTGILLADLLAVAGIHDDATSLSLTALDDYQVDIPVADAEKWPILLATRDNGDYMVVADGGPSRIIYPYHVFPNLDTPANHDLWVWNLATIEAR
jgi:hypothetical protein